jgi:hypothetical protein
MILVHPFYRNGKEKRQFGELKFGESYLLEIRRIEKRRSLFYLSY